MDVSSNTERNCTRNIQVTRHSLQKRHLGKMTLQKDGINEKSI